MNRKEPHIAIVRQSFRNSGGAERFVSQLLAALDTTHLQTTLITRNWQRLQHNDTRVITCNPRHFGRTSRDAGFAKSVGRVLKEQQFDLVQTHERIHGCDIFRAGDGVHAQWLENRAIFMSRATQLGQHLSRYHRYILETERRLLQAPTLKAIICNSKMVSDEICSRFSVPRNKVHVIHNAVDLQHFNPDVRTAPNDLRQGLGIPGNAPIFLFVGSGFERKGLRFAIDAIASSNAHLIVAGSSNRLESYRRKARRSGCGSRVHFVGVQPDLRPYYAICNAIVLPAIYDPFPNVILEAMACGVPAITSTFCGAREIIHSGVNGFTISITKDTELANAVRLVSDQDHAQSLGQNARRSAEKFTATRLRNEMSALYRTLVGSTHATETLSA